MFIRVISGKRRTFRVGGGTERHDGVIYNNRTLKGFIRFRKIRGKMTEETCFYHQKSKQMLTQPGVNFYWLAEQNSIQFQKVA